MAWDFSTEPDFQKKLDWMDSFVREEIEPIGLVWDKSTDPFDVKNETTRALVKPLQAEVKKRGLWACHLTPDLGGQDPTPHLVPVSPEAVAEIDAPGQGAAGQCEKIRPAAVPCDAGGDEAHRRAPVSQVP